MNSEGSKITLLFVTVDARTVYGGTRRGTGKCLSELYRRIGAMRPDWRLVMLHRDGGASDPFVDLANVDHRQIEIRGDRWGLWQKVRLPLAARVAGANVLHCPANTGPRWPLVPMLLTIHDLIPLQAEFATPASEKWGKRVAAAAKKARLVSTPSEYTKAQIVKTFGLPPKKIIVHHWAANPKCRPVRDRDVLNGVRREYGVEADQPYALSFGGLDPRKNTRRILEAWASLPQAQRRDAALLVVGLQEPLLSELRGFVATEELSESCHVQSYVPEEDLPALLSGAAFLCFPSLSEGFGLPVLDAFACETAVMTSKVTSIPEVAGDAAYYVDPRSTGSIAQGMSELLREESLRRDLVRRARKRLSQFSWGRCAEVFCGVLEEFI